MDFTEVVRPTIPRKSLARRVSFASHAHVRLFEKQDPNASADVSKSGSEDDGDSDGERDPVELDFLNADEEDTPRRPYRRRSSTGFSELGEQSMSMDTDADDTGPIPQDFLGGPALNDEQFDNDVYGDDMDMTEVIPGSIKPRPSLGVENQGATGRRRSSTTPFLTSSHSQSENQPSRKPLGVVTQSGSAGLYPSLDDIPDPSSPGAPATTQDPDVSIGADLSDMDLTVGSTVEPTISSTGDENTQPMEFTIPVVRPPPPPSEAWLTLRAMTHAGAEQPYVPPDIEASDDPEANAIVSDNGHHGERSPDRSDQEDDSMDLTVALNRLAQARPSLGIPPLSENFSPDEDDDEVEDGGEDTFASHENSLEADMSLDGNQTVNLTSLRLSMGGRTTAGDASMEFTNVYSHGQQIQTSTTDAASIATPVAQSDAQQQTVQGVQQEPEPEPQAPSKLPVFTFAKSQSSAQPPSQQTNTPQPPLKPSFPLPVFTLAPTAQDPSQSQPATQNPQSPNKPSTKTTAPTPFTFSVPSRLNSRNSPEKAGSATSSSKPPPSNSPKKLPVFRGSAAFAPPSVPKSPRKRPAPPAEDDDQHAPSPAKKQAVERHFPPNKPQSAPANEAPQNRRLSAVRRPSGYFAQRKSLGGAGPTPSIPPPNLSKSTSIPTSLNSSSQPKVSVPVPPSFNFRGAIDENASTSVQQPSDKSAVARIDHEVPESHLQQAPSSPRISPNTATQPSVPNEHISVDTSRVSAPEHQSLEHGSPDPSVQRPVVAQGIEKDVEEPDSRPLPAEDDENYLDDEDEGMTDRWRGGLADEELGEEDEVRLISTGLSRIADPLLLANYFYRAILRDDQYSVYGRDHCTAAIHDTARSWFA